METARMIKKISFHASCFFSFNTLTFIKKSYRNKKRPIGAEKIFQVCYDDYCERRMALSKKLLVS